MSLTCVVVRGDWALFELPVLLGFSRGHARCKAGPGLQKHEEDVRAAALTADISSLRSKLDRPDHDADAADGDRILALPPAHAAIGGTTGPDSGQRASHVTHTGSATVVERMLLEKSSVGRTGLDASDVASIYRCLGEVRTLRERLAEREQEVGELLRSRQRCEAQYALLKQEHSEVLGRLDTLLAAGPDARGGEGEGRSMGAEAKLAAAERAAALLRSDLEACEARLRDAHKVRKRDTVALSVNRAESMHKELCVCRVFRTRRRRRRWRGCACSSKCVTWSCSALQL